MNLAKPLIFAAQKASPKPGECRVCQVSYFFKLIGYIINVAKGKAWDILGRRVNCCEYPTWQTNMAMENHKNSQVYKPTTNGPFSTAKTITLQEVVGPSLRCVPGLSQTLMYERHSC